MRSMMLNCFCELKCMQVNHLFIFYYSTQKEEDIVSSSYLGLATMDPTYYTMAVCAEHV